MTTYTKFIATNILVSNNLNTDTSPTVITKDQTTETLNREVVLTELGNHVPTTKTVKAALKVYSTDSSTLAAIQAMQTELANGRDIAIGIGNITRQVSATSIVQNNQSTQASTLSSVQSDQFPQASMPSSANSNITSSQSTLSRLCRY